MPKLEQDETWVVYQAVLKGMEVGPHGVCEQREWDEMQRIKPGSHALVQSGIASEGTAERLARGTAGDPKPRVTRDSAR